jgi:hypothetical protein
MLMATHVQNDRDALQSTWMQKQAQSNGIEIVK